MEVTVAINKEAKTLTISDRGVGMTAEEIDRYINQIAFSGAEEFVTKYKDKMDSGAIIGHFGLGFTRHSWWLQKLKLSPDPSVKKVKSRSLGMRWQP